MQHKSFRPLRNHTSHKRRHRSPMATHTPNQTQRRNHHLALDEPLEDMHGALVDGPEEEARECDEHGVAGA